MMHVAETARAVLPSTGPATTERTKEVILAEQVVYGDIYHPELSDCARSSWPLSAAPVLSETLLSYYRQSAKYASLMWLYSLDSERYELAWPLFLEVRSDVGGPVVLCARDVPIYGEGATLDDARRHLAGMLLDYYEDLCADADILSAGLARDWELLRALV